MRIKRADLPEQNEKAVFSRMQAERERQAKQYRAEGAEEAQRSKSEAEKDREIILAGPIASQKSFVAAAMPRPLKSMQMRTVKTHISLSSRARWKRIAKPSKSKTTILVSPDSNTSASSSNAKLHHASRRSRRIGDPCQYAHLPAFSVNPA
ncbi:MAG: hypothetical protein MRJ92_02260 [Nitrospira sp.]|nr:hypothetical protein [Nitrospira sp.]